LWNIGILAEFLFEDTDMKKHWIEYSLRWQPSSLIYWVHVETDGRSWFTATFFAPLLPVPIDSVACHRRPTVALL
jgi:hypothetical protein